MTGSDPSLPADPGLIGSSVADLAGQLSEGRIDTVCALFASHACGAPAIVWRPTAQNFRQPLLHLFGSICAGIAPAPGAPVPVEAFDRLDLRNQSDWLMRVEVVDGGADFEYRYYGPEIAAVYGRDMTGRRTSDFGGHISQFFLALYRAAMIRREWVLSVHEPPTTVFAQFWRRLIVPLSEAEGRIAGFAIQNVADNVLRPGLEAVPDPVFLIYADGTVFFANAAAQEVFGYRSFTRHPITLVDYTALDLPLDESGQRPRPQHLRTVIIQDNEPAQFSVTTRPLLYRDQTCHIVVAKRS